MKKTTFFLASAVVVLVASGCQNHVITDQCFKESPQLLYPQPGATGIADPHLQLWFGSPGDPSPIFFRPVMTPIGGGQSVRGGTYSSPSPGPLPSGAATPRPNDQVFVSAIPTFAPATTYNVTIASQGCAAGGVGTFSTK